MMDSMKRRRILDGLIGAAIMLAVIAVVGIIVWLSMSKPSKTPAPAEHAQSSQPTTGEAPVDLGEKDVWIGDLEMQSSSMTLQSSTLEDVEAVATGLLSTEEGVTADYLDVTATVPFEEVTKRLGAGSTIAFGDENIATVERSIQFQGREIQVRASGTVEAIHGLVVVEPTEIDVEGPEFISWLATQAARQFVRIEYPIEGLPEQLVLEDVKVQEDGFRTRLTGHGVDLTVKES